MKNGSNYFCIICLLIMAMFFATSALAAPKHNVGSWGYFRFNSGISQGNNEQEIFKAPGASAKYRLGNEIDNFLEIGLYDTYKFSDDENSPYIHAAGMITTSTPRGFGDFEYGDFEDFYMEAGNITKFLGNPKIWAGRRFFLGRYTTHINDFAFLSTGGGFADGFGVRDMDLGVGNLAVKFNRAKAVAESGDSVFQTNADVRLSDVQANENGKLMFWGLYSTSSDADGIEDTDGWAAGIMHTQEKLFGGYNRLMIQYGTGLARTAGTTGKDDSLGTVTTSAQADALSDAITWRISDELAIEPSKSFGLITAFIYENKDSKDFDGTDQTWLSVGVRPYWFVTDKFRIPLEVGYDYVDNKVTDASGSLLKATLCAELALERGVWTRPVLRAYTTMAKWSDDFKGQIGGATFANDTDGWTAGFQIEYWW